MLVLATAGVEVFSALSFLGVRENNAILLGLTIEYTYGVNVV